MGVAGVEKVVQELVLKLLTTLHWQMWHWLARNPETAKSDWPGWRFVPTDRDLYNYNDCLVCEAAALLREWFGKREAPICDYCLVDWGVEKDVECTTCENGDTAFTRWKRAETPRTRAKYARIIRDLPIKWERVDEFRRQR